MNKYLLAALLIPASTLLGDHLVGSFENPVGLSDWSVSGTVVASMTPGSTEGLQSALLTSRNTTASVLATFVGAPLASLQAATGSTRVLTNGSAMKRTIECAAGDTLSFDFRFNNGEIANDIAWPDSAMFIVDGVPQLLATSGNLPHGWTPAFVAVNKTNLTAGMHTIAFAVFNLNDFSVDSQLAVDNVRIITPTCGVADVGVQGGLPGSDHALDNNDFIAFIDLFFVNDVRADVGSQGGIVGHDGLFDNNDFVAFIDRYFAGC